MKATLEYLSRKNQELIATNYSGQSCDDISIETAMKLVEDGLTPHIERVFELIRDERGNEELKSLFPKPLNNKDWGAHLVCCTKDLAFDPLIGKPVPKSEYCMILFGDYIAMEFARSKDETLRDIEKYKERRR